MISPMSAFEVLGNFGMKGVVERKKKDEQWADLRVYISTINSKLVKDDVAHRQARRLLRDLKSRSVPARRVPDMSEIQKY